MATPSQQAGILFSTPAWRRATCVGGGIQGRAGRLPGPAWRCVTLGFGPADQLVTLPWKFGCRSASWPGAAARAASPDRGAGSAATITRMGRGQPHLTRRAANAPLSFDDSPNSRFSSLCPIPSADIQPAHTPMRVVVGETPSACPEGPHTAGHCSRTSWACIRPMWLFNVVNLTSAHTCYRFLFFH